MISALVYFCLQNAAHTGAVDHVIILRFTFISNLTNPWFSDVATNATAIIRVNPEDVVLRRTSLLYLYSRFLYFFALFLCKLSYELNV